MGALMGTLQQVMDAASRRDMQAFLDCMTDDIEYKYHVNARPLVGKTWVEKFLKRYWDEMTDTHWRVDRFAENGNFLLVEGCEEYVVKATGRKVSHPYMGICEFRDGKIARMRDYFEMGDPSSG
jgi:ketosteroid isomerase-like protein